MSRKLERKVAVLEARLDERDIRYEQRFQSQESAVNTALTAQEKAVLKAESASEKRFESVNEFRRTLTDQAATFATKERVDGLAARVDKQEGAKSGISDLWGWIFGAASLVVAGLALWKGS